MTSSSILVKDTILKFKEDYHLAVSIGCVTNQLSKLMSMVILLDVAQDIGLLGLESPSVRDVIVLLGWESHLTQVGLGQTINTPLHGTLCRTRRNSRIILT